MRPLSRREFMGACFGLAGAGFVWERVRPSQRQAGAARGAPAATPRAAASDEPTAGELAALDEGLRRLFPTPEGAVNLGTIYRQRVPEEATAGTLLDRVVPGGRRAAYPLLTGDVARARARIATLVGEDFRAGRLAAVAGWQLAHVEARLAALRAAVPRR